jgi:sugar/nucleoside kinase (ribokinase family)
MLAIVGTVPDKNFPITHGLLSHEGNLLRIDNATIDINRGTPALMAAAVLTAEKLGAEAPYGFLVGDIGLDTLTFHYLQPIAHWHDRVLGAIEALHKKPVLIADAGFMYAAKMSGSAGSYDLFTPDLGELAFLADESSPHPFYTRGFILHDDNKAPELIERAYTHNNAARNLLVKGQRDYVVYDGKITATITEPSVETLEPIGGTGDTITGIVSVLISAGYDIAEAAEIAAQTNRFAGQFSNPTPATSVSEIISCIPRALDEKLGYDLRNIKEGTSRA